MKGIRRAGKLAGFLLLVYFLAGSHVATSGMLTVDQVYEADLIKLSDGRVIRLIGVEAPRINDPAFNDNLSKRKKIDLDRLKSFSYIAIQFVKNITEGKPVYVTYDKEFASVNNQDGQGRTLAYIWFPMMYKDNREFEGGDTFLGVTSKDRLLNSEVIKLGYGFSDGGTQHTYRKIFDEYEKKAKDNKKGLWQDKPPTYKDLLMRGQGALVAAMAEYVPADIRRMGIEFAKRTFTELIDMQPADYRAYYERSWIGADIYHQQVSDTNLSDIQKAISLSPRTARCYAQQHFLYRLMNRHQEASDAYRMAVMLSPELYEGPYVSESMKRSLNNQSTLLKLHEVAGAEGLMVDAYRAGLNEQHFLFFMARFKWLGGRDQALQKLWNNLMEQPRFVSFYQKHEDFLKDATPVEILYSTDYAKKGVSDPEGVLARMNQR